MDSELINVDKNQQIEKNITPFGFFFFCLFLGYGLCVCLFLFCLFVCFFGFCFCFLFLFLFFFAWFSLWHFAQFGLIFAMAPHILTCAICIH